MLSAPAFWSHGGVLARVMSPLSAIGAVMTARRVARAGWRAPVPVICCGNVTVGGGGKTTLVLDLARRLIGRGLAVHILLRGYGGSSRGVHKVNLVDSAALVGDEALLLAAVAPTWVAADRRVSAQAAVAAGADVLLMDDGLQNPTLEKTCAILVVDGRTGFGNGRVLPAGPLREPVRTALQRCHAVVLIGPNDKGGSMADLPVLRAALMQDEAIVRLAGRRVLPFAGIALPEKFFSPLRQAGAIIASTRSYPDHHAYTARDLDSLGRQAETLDALLVTTPKDAVRLPSSFRQAVTVIGVRLAWDDPAAVSQLLDRALGGSL
jgi:tetraacyldisaccharide 4'-kinase